MRREGGTEGQREGESKRASEFDIWAPKMTTSTVRSSLDRVLNTQFD